MCIRDRPISFYGKSHTKENAHELFAVVVDVDYVGKQQLKNLLKQFGNGVQPVSYTHLDVYKRQVFPEGSFERAGHFEDGKANGIITTVSYTHLDVYKRQL